MYNTKNIIGTADEHITQLDLYTNQTVTRTKAQWLRYFCVKNIRWEDVCAQLNVTGNDMYSMTPPSANPYEQIVHYTRRYLYYSKEDGRCIDIRTWGKDIQKELEKRAHTRYHFWYPEYLARTEGGGLPVFRRDPIPCIHVGHGYCGLRYMHTTNERRQNADPEVLPFVRGPRRPNNLVNAYDDIFRSSSRSWKKNKKVRHQWEKKHKKGEFCCKFDKTYIPELAEDISDSTDE